MYRVMVSVGNGPVSFLGMIAAQDPLIAWEVLQGYVGSAIGSVSYPVVNDQDHLKISVGEVTITLESPGSPDEGIPEKLAVLLSQHAKPAEAQSVPFVGYGVHVGTAQGDGDGLQYVLISSPERDPAHLLNMLISQALGNNVETVTMSSKECSAMIGRTHVILRKMPSLAAYAAELGDRIQRNK